MNYLVYIVVFFSLMLFQTTVLPALFDFVILYDLLIIFVIYIGFHSTLLEGLPAILLMGLVMDCLSGGAFGVFTTSYLWLYAVVTILIQYLHVASRFLLIITIVAGVLWENIIIIMTIAMGHSGLQFSSGFIKNILVQLILVVLTGPPVFFMIKMFHSTCAEWFKILKETKEEKSDF